MRVRSEIDELSAADSAIASVASDIQITAVAGGRDRVESVQLALKHASGAEVVLVHDAARALTPPEVFRRVVEAVRSGAEAVVPVLPMTDTVRRAENREVEPVEVLRGDLDRSSLRRVQTPQGFLATTLRRAHERYANDVAELGLLSAVATDDAGLVERLGVDVVAVDGDEEALKITYPLDLVLGEHIATLRDDAAAATRDDKSQRGEQR